MALTLDEISAAPNDPTELYRHLTDRGYLTPPPAPPPLVPSATIGGTMSPVTVPAATVNKPLTPVNASAPAATFAGTRAGPSFTPMKPVNDLEMGQPDMGAQPTGGTGALDTGVKPMTPPTLTHAEKMALPQTSPGVPNIGSAAFTENQLERMQEQKEHPGHGFLHTLGRIGNIAGDILAPGITAAIPGSDLNKQVQEHQLKRELASRTAAEGQAKNLASEEEARGVQTEEGRTRLAKLQNEQTLDKDAQGNPVGWTDAKGVKHGLDEEGTPQGIKDQAEASKTKGEAPHLEKVGNDIVQVTTDKDGKATSNVVYKGRPDQKTETRSLLGPDGHNHDYVVDITPGGASMGQRVADLGRSREDKQPSIASELAKEKAGERVVLAYDKDGKQHLMSKNDAQEEGMTHITAASTGDIDKAKTHHSVLNTLQTQLNSVVDSSKALDQNELQRGIIASALAHSSGGTIDSLVSQAVMSQATPETQKYVRAVLALREAGLALPKEITGGSRVSEVQASALWGTMPDAKSLNSKYAIEQSKKFQQDIDRLRERAPEVRGQSMVDPDDAIKSSGTEKQRAGGGAAPKPPEGKTTVYDKTGEPHFVNSDKVDKFLKDPKYSGWSKNAPK
jgi:hypothetical protein